VSTVPPYEAIRNLLGTYCHLIDSGDFDGLGRLFTDAVLLDDRGRLAAKGAEAATALWSGMIKRYDDGTPRTRHVTANPVIELDSDHHRATCRSSFLVLQQLGKRLEVIAAGRYVDEFSSSEGIWRFTSRQFFLDQIGDVSQHMNEV
jgi:3-phenylpropionate/cinnamic acid dioxygenase small subunit